MDMHVDGSLERERQSFIHTHMYIYIHIRSSRLRGKCAYLFRIIQTLHLGWTDTRMDYGLTDGFVD